MPVPVPEPLSDSVTLILDGKVTLAELAKAIQDFDGLVEALSKEVAGNSVIEWVVSDLRAGSAFATAQGFGLPNDVNNVVRAFENVGSAMQTGAQIPYSDFVASRAVSLTNVINGKIKAVRFETDRTEVLITKRVQLAPPAPPLQVAPPVASVPPNTIGMVEGIVETLSKRQGLRFVLYDSLNDKAVSCYLAPGYETVMRDAWGKRALVSGVVHRDPETGRALSVRRVTGVDVIEEQRRGDWRRARGSAPPTNDMSPEQAIRLTRDA